MICWSQLHLVNVVFPTSISLLIANTSLDHAKEEPWSRVLDWSGDGSILQPVQPFMLCVMLGRPLPDPGTPTFVRGTGGRGLASLGSPSHPHDSMKDSTDSSAGAHHHCCVGHSSLVPKGQRKHPLRQSWSPHNEGDKLIVQIGPCRVSSLDLSFHICEMRGLDQNVP